MKSVCVLLALVSAALAVPLPGEAIFGGSPVASGQFPFFVQLTLNGANGQSVCGGSLISNRHVLTAAHCCQGSVNDGKAVLGFTDLAKLDAPGVQNKKVVGCVANPEFGVNGKGGFFNDIAVVELESAVEFTESVQPVKVPNRDFFLSFESPVPKASVIGFDGASSQVQYARVQFANHFTCEIQYKPHDSKINEKMICLARPGKGISKGDEGAPNVVTWKRVVYQMGLNSFFAEDLPSVSTRTSQYCAFLKSSTGGAFECSEFKP